MLVPALIFIACMVAGAVASARWLPDLAPGRTGGLAFFVVCGLLGAALGLAGLHIYIIAKELDHSHDLGPYGNKGEIVALGLRTLVYEVGTLLGLAVAIFLLAPPPEEAYESEG